MLKTNLDEEKAILAHLSKLLFTFDFRKNGRTFYKKVDGIIQLVRFRRHTFLECFFIDFGVYFTEVEDIRKYRISSSDMWHLYCNLGVFNALFRPFVDFNYFRENDKKVFETLDLEFIDHVIPFLNNLSDLDFIYSDLMKEENLRLITPKNSDVWNKIRSLADQKRKV